MKNPEFENLTMVIRDATLEDAAAIAEIQYSAWFDRYPKVVDGVTEEMVEQRFKPEGSLDARVNRWAESIKTADPAEKRFIVAEYDGRVVGYNIPTKNDGGVGVRRPSSLYVDPDYQGKSIGSALFLESLLWLEADQFEVELHVAEGNEQTIMMYQKFGFQECGYVQGNVAPFENGLVIPEVLMKRAPAPLLNL